MVQSAERADLTEVEICRLYESGVGAPTIQKMIGRSQCYVDAVLDRGGVVKRGPGRLPDKPRPERRLPDEVRETVIGMYRDGASGKEIERLGGVSRATAIRWARDAGIEIRYQKTHAPEVLCLFDEGCSAREVSRRTGLGRKVVLRILQQSGRDKRRQAHAKWYWHESPVVGRVRLHGTWELAYARILDRWWERGEIKKWDYEPDRLKLSEDTVYIPDFKVFGLDQSWAYHEVKGRFWGRSLEKVNMARSAGFSVVLVRRPMLEAICVCEGVSLAS